MSIKHLLLALLHEQPAHGYELKKRCDETLGDLWPLQQAQVYNNLRLLEQDGLIAPSLGGDSGSPRLVRPNWRAGCRRRYAQAASSRMPST
jgi:DNA-binding PadR family transcriptional regulator